MKNPELSRYSSYTRKSQIKLLIFPFGTLTLKVKSCIQDTNELLKIIANLPSLSDDPILCIVDAVGSFPNIPHEEGLIATMKALDTRKDQTT